jgi:hypothetical protein
MTEKIKIALLEWAKKVLNQEAQWDEEKTHEAIQKLYELSIVQKMLLEEETVNNDQWKRQQTQLNEVIESLTGESKKERSKEENMEVAPMMETIKNMVTEMPEPETYEKLFETIEDMPTFVPKDKEERIESNESQFQKAEERKNINDHFAKTLSIDLNDRLAFIKHLFEEDSKTYERVLAQVITYETWEEVFLFIEAHVKTEYDNWTGKEEVVERFLNTLQKNFET